MFVKTNLFPKSGQGGLLFGTNKINLIQIYLKWAKINMQKTSIIILATTSHLKLTKHFSFKLLLLEMSVCYKINFLVPATVIILSFVSEQKEQNLAKSVLDFKVA